ncbi:efflux transporter outer membrane subunit [Cupriavidus pampae]|uniref:Toluene efflux pump outer membrane protein TtgF n=1 Tax=Cupriavidus pampae TaxID=659251 RepID=A0ABM8WHB2_9BURK|nr:Toluene efflux pump outer membrane protein TtgF [Cupriavidus pampae]
MKPYLKLKPWARGLSMSSVAIASLALVGCAVGPDYVKPQTALALFHNTAASASADSSTGQRVVDLDAWWTGFDDPMLVTVIERALAQNLDLAAALARVEQARAVAQAAGAELLPTFDLSATATAQRQSQQSPLGTIARTFPGYDRNLREYTAGAVASWEIDLAGGLRRGAAAARAEAQAASADHVGTRVTVAADAADAYLQIRGYQSRLAVALDQITTDERLLDLVRERRRYGAADDRQVSQADALLRQARATVPLLRIALEAQLNRLDVLMGVQPGTYAAELATPPQDTVRIPKPPGVAGASEPLEMLRRRPDVLAAERRLAASNERIGAALADYYPKLSLAGALGFDSITTNGLFSARSFQPVGTAGLRWRLFDFGKIDAEVKQARGGYAEALAGYRQSILRAAEDVENAMTAMAQTEVRRQELQAEVAALQRARELSEQAYRLGAITLTDVLDADRQLLVARDGEDEARTNTSRAAVSLFRSLGGGWTVPSDAPVAAAPAAVATAARE